MTQLISIQGWDRLLCVIVEPNGQPWLCETLLGQLPGLPQYTRVEFLDAWIPLERCRQ